MSMVHHTHELVRVIDEVIRQVDTETQAPLSLTDLDSESKQFLERLRAQLHQAKDLATQVAA